MPMIWPWRRHRRTDPHRWLVVDVETTGLDPHHDRLLAIAAVALTLDGPAAPRLTPGDSFEVVIQQDRPHLDRDNILLHGIGIGAQRLGQPAALALAAFEAWAADAPFVAFHAGFDEIMIQRHAKAHLGRVLAQPWLDLAPLARLAVPDTPHHALDDWLRAFDIPCAARHQAACDVWVTAQLLQRLWPALRAHAPGMHFEALSALERSARWLGRHA